MSKIGSVPRCPRCDWLQPLNPISD